jgi:hypothetical protein
MTAERAPYRLGSGEPSRDQAALRAPSKRTEE